MTYKSKSVLTQKKSQSMLLFLAIQFAIDPMTNKRETLIATSLEKISTVS